MPPTTDLLALERRFWLEASERLYRDRMTADGLMAFSVGTLDKEQTLDAIAAAGPWSEVELDDVRTVELADGVTALVYRATGRREGQEPYTAVASSVYVLREGEWLLALHQQTPVG